MKVTQYNKSKLGNLLLTLKTALSPRVPKLKRKTLAQIDNYNTFHKRQSEFIRIIKNK